MGVDPTIFHITKTLFETRIDFIGSAWFGECLPVEVFGTEVQNTTPDQHNPRQSRHRNLFKDGSPGRRRAAEQTQHAQVGDNIAVTGQWSHHPLFPASDYPFILVFLLCFHMFELPIFNLNTTKEIVAGARTTCISESSSRCPTAGRCYPSHSQQCTHNQTPPQHNRTP